ncbi:MAG TPA: serine hydrolase domain-containing protein [Pyrinomonadaceae bacterium]|nr:serine hydrolase domain-containing protein [Pyrinomonadaceae bacterium]
MRFPLQSLMSVCITLILCCSNAAFPLPRQKQQPVRAHGPTDARELEQFLDKIFTEEMQKEQIPGAAFVFVKDGAVLFSKGYGFVDLERTKPVSPERTIFRIGSISKVFTATAVVQLADRGKLNLQHDVNRYLKKIKVPTTYPQPITAAQLLNHTAGLDEIRPGTQAPTSEGVLTLPAFLQTRLRRIRPPGEVISYSTYGITLAGQLIEEVSGTSFESYLKTNIWQPLGMNRTSITVPESLASDLAVGYEYGEGVNQPQRYEWYHTTPASSINSTALDMSKFMLMHLATRGTAKRILSERALRDMHSRHARGHPQVPGVAYGFFEDEYQGLRILEHGGNMVGFSSQLVLLPEENAGFFMVNHHENSNLRDTVKWAILERYYSNPTPIKTPVARDDYKARGPMFAGTYQWNVFCHTCPHRTSGPVLRVSSNDDGTLKLSNGPRRWIEVEPMLFVRDDGKARIAFQSDKSGKVKYLYANGFWVFERTD